MDKENLMKHAFLLMAHGEGAVLDILLSQLDDERNDIFLHVDRKYDVLYERVQKIKLKKANLICLEKRFDVQWGNFTQVETEMMLFETAWRRGGYDYYHLLSGVDLMIKSMNELDDFLQRKKGKEFVAFWQGPAHEKDLKRKTRYFYCFTKHYRGKKNWKRSIHVFLRNFLLSVQKALNVRRRYPWVLKKGSNWVSVTNDFVGYLLNQKALIRKYFHHTLCPDEIFLQTLLWNSSFKERLCQADAMMEGSLRAIDWERGKPYEWKTEDFQFLSDCPAFFARKFNADEASRFASFLDKKKEC